MKKLGIRVGIALIILIIACNGETISPIKINATEHKDIGKADKVFVEKSKRKLHLMRHDSIIKSYTICLGDSPIGPKTTQGDEKTPEGKYTIDYRNNKSSYHLSLHISYPNKADIEQAKKRGVSPGGDIMIHGLPNNKKSLDSIKITYDWTDGCIALNNYEIDEIWKAVDNGTPIEIVP